MEFFVVSGSFTQQKNLETWNLCNFLDEMLVHPTKSCEFETKSFEEKRIYDNFNFKIMSIMNEGHKTEILPYGTWFFSIFYWLECKVKCWVPIYLFLLMKLDEPTHSDLTLAESEHNLTVWSELIPNSREFRNLLSSSTFFDRSMDQAYFSDLWSNFLNFYKFIIGSYLLIDQCSFTNIQRSKTQFRRRSKKEDQRNQFFDFNQWNDREMLKNAKHK